MLPAIITDHQAEIDALCRKFHVRRLEVFGSAATGDWDPSSSDIDFLVSFVPGEWTTTQDDLKCAFEELFRREIDIVRDRKFDNPYFRQSVEESRTYLWGEDRARTPANGARMSDDPLLMYLWDIKREIGYLQTTVGGQSKETVLGNITLLRSLQMHLMVIGEALNHLSSRDAETYQRITDASGYVGQRNVLIHQYRDIDWDRVWRTVEEEIPLLPQEVTSLIAELDPQERDD